MLAVSEHDGELEQAIETTTDPVGCPECGAWTLPPHRASAGTD